MKILKLIAVLNLLAIGTGALADQMQSISGEYFKNMSVEYKKGMDIDERAAGQKAFQFCEQKGFKGMMAFYFHFNKLEDVFCANTPRTDPQVGWARSIIMKDRLARKAYLRPDAQAVMDKYKGIKFKGYTTTDLGAAVQKPAVVVDPGQPPAATTEHSNSD